MARELLGLCAAVMLVAGCSGGPEVTRQASLQFSAVPERPSSLFGSPPDNPFLLDISDAAVSPHSVGQMANLKAQLAENGGLAVINTRQYNTTYYIAEPGTPRVRVGFDDCQGKGAIPADLYDGPAHFARVPIPAAARPARGTDGHLAIWSRDTGQLWEFWKADRGPDGTWTACWGGRIDDLPRSGGVFPGSFGASASGLATVGSVITLAEARDRRIEHAISLSLPRIAVDDKTVAPATRSDGRDTSPNAIPMGARLRLDPRLDVEQLDLTPFAKAVARAAQRYGFVVTETSGRVSLGIQEGRQLRRGASGNAWDAVLGSTPDYFQLKGFPWQDVHVVQGASARSS